MKILKIVIGALFIFGAIVFVMSINIPSEVNDAFSRKYPSATSVQWDKDSSANWQAEFSMDGQEYIATLQEDGTWVTISKGKLLDARD